MGAPKGFEIYGLRARHASRFPAIFPREFPPAPSTY
jgi:hypothetical protein